LTTIFDRLSVLADTTRSRLLLLLERHELSVGELSTTMQLPQSTVSRHLKVLADQSWVASRAEGTSRFYRVDAEGFDGAARRIWTVVREQLSEQSAARQDRERAASVLAERRIRAEEFFSTAADGWDRMRTELFGSRTELLGLVGFVDPSWSVGDFGCGTGHVAAILAPFVTRVVGVDSSAEMLEAARQRLSGVPGVELHLGELEELPLGDGSLDAAVLFLVMHYILEPERVLGEVARVLRSGGRTLVVDMVPHDRDEYRQRMGHVWLGFGEDRVRELFRGSGFEFERYVVLPPEAGARGPLLFASSATRS
jgi:ubiquinone/menaquinone biosynthesis C-methylase UbiE/DNA-binding transcriptional ArsR family regulator